MEDSISISVSSSITRTLWVGFM